MEKLIIPKFIGFKEEDNYKEGCLPNTSFIIDFDISFSGNTQEEIINKIINYFGIDKESIILNSCDEKGRIDINVLEDENSNIITDRDKTILKEWKKEKVKLWNVIYTGYLEERKIKTWEN